MPPQLLLQRGNSGDVTLKVEPVQRSGPRSPLATGKKTGHRISCVRLVGSCGFRMGKCFIFYFLTLNRRQTQSHSELKTLGSNRRTSEVRTDGSTGRSEPSATCLTPPTHLRPTSAPQNRLRSEHHVELDELLNTERMIPAEKV